MNMSVETAMFVYDKLVDRLYSFEHNSSQTHIHILLCGLLTESF